MKEIYALKNTWENHNMLSKKQIRRRKQLIRIGIRLLFIFSVWLISFLFGFQSGRNAPLENYKSTYAMPNATDTGTVSSNNALAFEGKNIVIDAGHGGSDSIQI